MSTPFTEQPITTLVDWNAVLASACCCEMPPPDNPEDEYEGISGMARMAYAVKDLSTQTYYRKTRTEWADGGFVQDQAPATHWTIMGGVDIEPYNVINTQGDPKTGSSTTVRSEIVTRDQTRAAGFSAMQAALNWDNMSKGWTYAAIRLHLEWSSDYALNITFCRHRWAVPGSHTGTYYKIAWDVLEQPVGWDASPPTAERSFFLKDQIWEWTGPGDPEDPASWQSPWFYIPPPAKPGIRKVVNAKIWAHSGGPYGTLPTPFGEQVPRLDGESGGSAISGTLDLGRLIITPP